MKKHQKHTALTKPSGGRYHRNELGFIGAPCGTIQSLCSEINKSLSKKYLLGYMDADHGDGDSTLDYNVAYTDKIKFHRIDFHDNHTEYSLRSKFESCDVLMVNANHFIAHKQFVIINSKKEESLYRKLDRLTNVRAIILDEGMNAPFDFIESHIDDIQKIPFVPIDDLNTISRIIEEEINANVPTLNGLLLHGGKSSRMGKDKGEIEYHGIPQVDYLFEILNSHCEKTYWSVSGRLDDSSKENSIVDTFTGLGPFGGILSAFRYDPNCAYLSIPCDVPFIDESLIRNLIEHRDTSKVATCFHNKETDFPEPLITIWEPKAYSRLLYFLSLGYSCPRKVLINSDIKEIDPPHELSLFNANTPEESEFAVKKLAAIRPSEN